MSHNLDDSDMRLLTESPRKRKSVDPDCSSVRRASHRGEFDDSFGHRGSDSAIDHPVWSDYHSRNRHRTAQYENSSLLAPGMLQKDSLKQEETSRNLISSTFQGMGRLSNVNSYSQDGFVLSSSGVSLRDGKARNEPAQLPAYMGMESGYNDRSASCMDRSSFALKSCAGMDFKGDDNGFKQCQGSMNYLHKPFVEPCGQVFVNGYPESRPSNVTKERNIEHFKVGKSEHASYFSNFMGISASSTSPMRTSIGAGERDVSVMHENLSIYVGAGSEISQSNRGDIEKNTKSMSQMLAPAFSSNFEVTCSQDKGLKDITMDVTCSETRMPSESRNSQTDNKIQSFTTENSMKLTNDSILDEQIKVAVARTSSVVPDKLWDGSLQLSNSIIVSTIAFFKCGEKCQNIKWSELVEVKGKVRLAAFEKFVQEIPRSRTRTLMIISLCWKPGSFTAGLKGMKEIAQGYTKNARVGVAPISPGIDLYVCPHNETILAILKRYGFLKGMDATDKNQDSLIGCVVWRRSSQSSNSANNNILEKKEASVTDQTIHSPMSSIVEVNSSTKRPELPNKATVSLRESDMAPRQLLSQASCISDSAKGLITEAKDNKTSKTTCTDGSLKSIYGTWSTHSIYSTPLAPDGIPSQQKQERASFDETQKHSEKSTLRPENTTKLNLSPPKPPSVNCQLIHPFSAIMQSNFTYIGDSNNRATPLPSPPLPLNLPLPPGVPPYKLQEAKGSILVSGIPSAVNGLKAGIPMLHAKESKESSESSHINQIPLPQPPPLPAELLQKMVEMQKTMVKEISGTGPFPANSAANINSTETPIKDVSTGVTVSSGLIPPEAALRQPQPIVSSVTYRDIDDLPEFDFGAEIGPPNQSSAIPNVPMIKNRTLLESNNLKPVDASKMSQTSEKLLPQNKSMFQASQPEFQPYGFRKEAPSSPKSNHSTRKNRWDNDEDDMPEWCPPVQGQGDGLQISRSTNDPSLADVNSRVAPPLPLFPSPASSHFSRSEIQGSFGGNQHKRPCLSAVGHTRNRPSSETAAEARPFGSIQKPRNLPDADQSSRHNSSKSTERPSFNSYKRTRRY